VVAYQRVAGLVNEKAYDEFLYKCIRGEIVIRGASGITRVQGPARGYANTNGATSLGITQASTPTNGNLNILTGNIVTSSPTPISSIVQTGVTWSRVVNAGFTELWKGVVGSGASKTITVNFASSLNSANSAVANVNEYSGLDSSPLDKTATHSGGNSNLDSGTTSTTSQANELWVASLGNRTNNGGSATLTNPTNGFTLLDGVQVYQNSNYPAANAFMEKIVSTTGTANTGATASSTSSNYWDCCIATFKATLSTPISASDTGSGSDSSATPTLNISEAGSGVEALSNSVTFGVSDSGSGADSPTEEMDFLDNAIGGETPIWPSLRITDSGVGNDVESSSVTFTVGDSGSALDSPTEWMYYNDKSNRINVPGGNVNVGTFDAGAGVELLSLQVMFQVADAGIASGGTALNVSFSSADSGFGSEAFTVGPTQNDIGSGSEVPTLQATFTVGESGLGTEVSTEGPSTTDSGFGSDAQTLSATLTMTDLGLGSETSVSQVTFTVNDSGAGGEIFGKGFTVFDVGAGSDVYVLTGTIVATDTGVALESFTYLYGVSVADFAQGLDESTSPSYTGIVRLEVADSVQGADRFAIRVLRSGRLQYLVRLSVTENEFDPTAFDPYVYS
jgi:hypothetical protein